MRGIVLGFVTFGVLALVGCDTQRPPPPPPPTITVLVTKAAPPPTDTPILVQPTATAVPVPTLVPTPSPVPSSTAVPLIVGKTNGDGIWLRASAPLGDKLKALPDGTQMVVVGPDQNIGGKTWKNVKDPGGTVGWVASEYLLNAADTTPVGSPATPTKTPAG